MKNFSIDEIRAMCSEKQNQILDLYLQRKKQKEICEELGVTRGNIDLLVKKFNLTRFRDRKNYCCTHVDKEDPLFWYFLGLFASDGNLYVCGGIDVVQFTMDDLDAVETIKTIVGYTGPIQQYIRTGKIRYYLKISDSLLIRTIREVFGSDCYRKTFTIKYPSIDNEDKQKMFLRGFIDGDGSYAKKRVPGFYNIKLYCASQIFYMELLSVLNSITVGVNSYKNKYIEIDRKESVYKVLKHLYSIYPNIGIQRKNMRAMQHIRNYELKI